MSLTTRVSSDNPLGLSPYERAANLAHEYHRLLDRMSEGEVLAPSHDAWKDPNFQRLVAERLSNVGRATTDARKWAALKELFGEIGASRG